MSEPSALELKRSERIVKEEKDAEQAKKDMDAAMPMPKGYRVLIALPNIEETFGDSTILKANQTQRDEYILSMIGLVIDMGDMAYSDKDRFPTGPWCKTGDYVIFRANSGTRFMIAGQEFRLMNDDSVEAVVNEPKAISRA
jgi:co-chaperonin GroES (HSP10)